MSDKNAWRKWLKKRKREKMAAFLGGGYPQQPWEWMQVKAHAGDDERGWVPRWYAESIGVDCSPLDRRDEHGRQGTVWIRSDQSEQLHGSTWWRPSLDGAQP